MKSVNLTEEARSMLIGTVLGDGCIQLTNRGPNANPYFSVGRSVKDIDYLKWQHKILLGCGLVTAPIKYRQKEFLGKSSSQCYFISKHHPVLWELYNWFYPFEGKKMIFPEILAMVDPLALAVWYMDDGCLIKKGHLNSYRLTLHTQGFDYNENKLIQSWFLSKWGVKVRLEYAGYSIAISKRDEISKFIDIVSPYILPCMIRKLPERRSK